MPFSEFETRLARFRVEESPALIALIKRHEGERRQGARHVAYRCPAGALTIGWGHNLESSPVPGLGEGSSISGQEAENLLRADLARMAAQLDLRLPWWRGLGPARSAALLDMGFNLGLSGLLGFGKMLAAARAQRFDEAAAEMLTPALTRRGKVLVRID